MELLFPYCSWVLVFGRGAVLPEYGAYGERASSDIDVRGDLEGRNELNPGLKLLTLEVPYPEEYADELGLPDEELVILPDGELMGLPGT